MTMSTVPAVHGLKRAAGALTAALALGGSLLAAAPAQAAAPGQVAAPARPYGTVTTTAGLTVRQFPSTDSSSRGFLAYRQQVGLACKVRAQDIGGNTVWYLLRGTSHERWVTAKYVDNTGYVPYCKDVLRTATTMDSERQHPHAKG
ncbi:SH3 domain-containing protein [Streptomyces sp. NPDC058045]|uniref:SH3 domain-containing protein n=1 Tax=Streptomyces sp. NPDC058045 TaxID=3346311 RepID=UPI0036E2D3F1